MFVFIQINLNPSYFPQNFLSKKENKDWNVIIINSRHGNRARNRKLNDSTYLQKQSSFSRISRNEFEFVTRDGGQRTDFVIAVYRYHRITEASVRNLKWDDRLRVRIHICPFSIVRLNQDLLINSYVCVEQD